jgi:hypothetical protein
MTKAKWAGSVPQVIERLLCKFSSNPSPTPTKQKQLVMEEEQQSEDRRPLCLLGTYIYCQEQEVVLPQAQAPQATPRSWVDGSVVRTLESPMAAARRGPWPLADESTGIHDKVDSFTVQKPQDKVSMGPCFIQHREGSGEALLRPLPSSGVSGSPW